MGTPVRRRRRSRGFKVMIVIVLIAAGAALGAEHRSNVHHAQVARAEAMALAKAQAKARLVLEAKLQAKAQQEEAETGCAELQKLFNDHRPAYDIANVSPLPGSSDFDRWSLLCAKTMSRSRVVVDNYFFESATKDSTDGSSAPAGDGNTSDSAPDLGSLNSSDCVTRKVAEMGGDLSSQTPEEQQAARNYYESTGDC